MLDHEEYAVKRKIMDLCDPSLMIYYYTEWYSKWSQPPLVRCNWHIYPPIGNNHTPRNETNKRRNDSSSSVPEFPEPKVDLLIVRKAQNHFWSPERMCVLSKDAPKIWDVGWLDPRWLVGSTHDGEGVWPWPKGVGWLVSSTHTVGDRNMLEKTQKKRKSSFVFLITKIMTLLVQLWFWGFCGGFWKKKTVSSSTFFVGKYIIKSSPGWKYDRTPPQKKISQGWSPAIQQPETASELVV